MTEIADSGSGGLGTAGSICAISPSDMIGTIGNLIKRIEDLEFSLSQIVGADLHTEQLSNISQQVGWVYGVEYMGIPGWTRTEAGTLIPPTGSGIHFQLTRDGWGWYDTAGNLLFGGTSGAATMSGSKVDQWDTASGGQPQADYAYLASGVNEVRGITVLQNTLSGSNAVGNAYVSVSRAGLYLVSGINYSSGGASFGYGLVCAIKKNGSTIAEGRNNRPAADNSNLTVTLTRAVTLQASDTIEFLTSVVGGTSSGGHHSLSIIRISP